MCVAAMFTLLRFVSFFEELELSSRVLSRRMFLRVHVMISTMPLD